MPSSDVVRDHRMLLGALCALGLLYPMIALGRPGEVCWTAMFWVVLYVAIRSTRTGRFARQVDVALLVVVVLSSTAVLVFGFARDQESTIYDVLRGGAELVSLALLMHVTVTILREVLSPGRVDANRIWGAVCVYVLIGLIWAFGLGLLTLVFDDCLVASRVFRGAATADMDSLATRLYFSYVTLTTVGYGDIAPGNPETRIFCTAEAITGQLYLTVLLARLVGLHITHSHFGDRWMRSDD